MIDRLEWLVLHWACPGHDFDSARKLQIGGLAPAVSAGQKCGGWGFLNFPWLDAPFQRITVGSGFNYPQQADELSELS